MGTHTRKYEAGYITFKAKVIRTPSTIQRKITIPKELCDEYDIQPLDLVEVKLRKLLPIDDAYNSIPMRAFRKAL